MNERGDRHKSGYFILSKTGFRYYGPLWFFSKNQSFFDMCRTLAARISLLGDDTWVLGLTAWEDNAAFLGDPWVLLASTTSRASDTKQPHKISTITESNNSYVLAIHCSFLCACLFFCFPSEWENKNEIEETNMTPFRFSEALYLDASLLYLFIF